MFIAHGDLEVIDFKGICFLMDHPKLFWICTFSSTYTSIRKITNGLNKSDVQNLTVKVFLFNFKVTHESNHCSLCIPPAEHICISGS